MKKRRKNEVPLCLMIGIFFVSSIFTGSAAIKPAQAGIADHVVINEVHIDTFVGAGGTEDDWVELYNPTTSEIILDGWSIQKFSSGGTSIYNQALNGTIPANGYFLIVRNGASTSPALKEKADLLANNSFSLASNNIIYLSNNSININPASSTSYIDLVGYGTSIFFEGAAAAPDVQESKSITRSPDGEETDNNSVDFIVQNNPTPLNSGYGANNISGSVALTITKDPVPVQNIASTGADIVFQLNAIGTAEIKYGLSSTYDHSTLAENILENTSTLIGLNDLECNKTYHYAIYAENETGTEYDQTVDATFTTLPCGIKIDSLTMTKSSAKANNIFSDGWAWEFDITIWNMNETSLKMKFAEWTGAGALNSGGNMEYSADNGANWQSISANDTYPSTPVSLTGIDNSPDPGRQVKILVRMKVPAGTRAGTYNSSYGILTE